MDDLYAAITRIQQLEAEIVRLTNEKLRREASQTYVSPPLPITSFVNAVTETHRFVVLHEIPIDTIEADTNNSLRETMRRAALDRLLHDLGPMLYREGFLSQIHEEIEVNSARRTETLALTATLKISR